MSSEVSELRAKKAMYKAFRDCPTWSAEEALGRPEVKRYFSDRRSPAGFRCAANQLLVSERLVVAHSAV